MQDWRTSFSDSDDPRRPGSPLWAARAENGLLCVAGELRGEIVVGSHRAVGSSFAAGLRVNGEVAWLRSFGGEDIGGVFAGRTCRVVIGGVEPHVVELALEDGRQLADIELPREKKCFARGSAAADGSLAIVLCNDPIHERTNVAFLGADGMRGFETTEQLTIVAALSGATAWLAMPVFDGDVFGGFDVTLRDAEGRTRRTARLDTLGSDLDVDLRAMPDGGLLVFGTFEEGLAIGEHRAEAPGILQGFVARLDATGACRWFQSPEEWGFCTVIAEPRSDGGAQVMITDDGKQVSLVSLDPDGRVIARRALPGSWERPASMIVDAGELIVTDREVVRADMRRRFVARYAI